VAVVIVDTVVVATVVVAAVVVAAVVVAAVVVAVAVGVAAALPVVALRAALVLWPDPPHAASTSEPISPAIAGHRVIAPA
jgi:hypothetical protein